MANILREGTTFHFTEAVDGNLIEYPGEPKVLAGGGYEIGAERWGYRFMNVKEGRKTFGPKEQFQVTSKWKVAPQVEMIVARNVEDKTNVTFRQIVREVDKLIQLRKEKPECFPKFEVL